MTTSMKASLELIKKKLAKRSFNVQFDLENTDYKPIENIGIGAYGVVCSAIHKKTQDKVAIKKIPLMSHKDVTKRSYREIKILKHFKHDNIINIRELLKPKTDDFQEIYVVFDLMESDLHRIIYTDQELTEEHTRYFLYQILRGLKYIHSANVIHRDLKPSNLLVNEDCHVKIGDFGMARGITQARDDPCYFMTQYVATRWYRAPEILLALVEYGSAVDMWSVGCIFAEMLLRKSLFPGKDHLNQINLIIGLLGSPSPDVLKKSQTELIAPILKGLSTKQAVPLKNHFPKASKKALNLLSQMLVIDPFKRISVEKALRHPFLSKYHDPDDEPTCVPTFDFDFEKQNLDKNELHNAIYKEIMEFHQPKTPTLSFNAILRPAPKTEEVPVRPTAVHQLQQEQPKLDSDLDVKDKEVFKAPHPQPNNLVTVNTNALVPPHSSDVIMLSAQSTDGKHEMEVMPQPQKPDGKEDRRPLTKQTTAASTENKTTLSSDTKALAKQALLNANQRRNRTESASDESSGKPRTTAAQRQKERQDKREKKKNKLLERQRKQREKQANDAPEYSSQDKAMLERWSTMAPKIAPAQGTTNQGITINIQGGNVTLPSIPHNTQPAQTVIAAASGPIHGTATLVDNQCPNAKVDTEYTKTPACCENSKKSPPPTSHPTALMEKQNLSHPDPLLQGSSQTSVSFPGQPFLASDVSANSGSCMFSNQGDFSVTNVKDSTSVSQTVNTSPTHPSQDPTLTSQASFSVSQGSPPLDVSFVGIDLLDIVNQGTHLQRDFQFHPYPDQQPHIAVANKRHSIETSIPGSYQQPFPAQDTRHNRLSEGSTVHQLTSFVGQSFDSQSIPFQTPTHGFFKQESVPFVPSNFEEGEAAKPRERADPGLKVVCSSVRNSTPDQIALLTKQMSKSQMEDPFPPILSLTPKGTGCGYGVGTDLDALMLDAHDGCSAESPLSSSLIADWLAVRGNISLADIEALEQELAQHSPMTL